MQPIVQGIVFLCLLTSFAEPARFSHRNNISTAVTKEIVSPDKESTPVPPGVDSLPGYRGNTLSKLEDKDTISIYFQSFGCFHATASKIVINKQDGKYYASLYDVRSEYTAANTFSTLESRSDSLLKTVALSKMNIDDFIRFERGLGVVRDCGCTTIDSYQFRSKYRNVDRTDGSCSWRGFNFLRKSFFGSTE